MDRRLFLKGSLAAAGAVASPALAQTDVETAAIQAWIYGLMLIENAQARAKALSGAAVNRLIHARDLTTPTTQSVTTPNNDTLYSRAWIDLTAGPVTLDMPAMGKRYVSYAFMDMYGNNFAVLGTRTTGGGAHRVTLVGPAQATKDPMALRAPTPWVWLLVRTLIDGDADKAAANALQDQIRLTGPARPKPPVFATRDAPWDQYFASVQALINENPPPVSDLVALERMAPLGIKVGGKFEPSRFSSADAARIQAALPRARALMQSYRPGRAIQGWTYPKGDLGDFGQDYLYRAQVAISGLAALPVVEAMYMNAVGADGGALDSARSYVLRFEKGQLPPVDAFWSITSYQRTAAGQQFFFANPINRYAIGDRTPGLKYGGDGSLEIYISRNDPGEAKRSNWLPAAPTGPLSLNLRTYMPRDELISGKYLLPALK